MRMSFEGQQPRKHQVTLGYSDRCFIVDDIATSADTSEKLVENIQYNEIPMSKM